MNQSDGIKTIDPTCDDCGMFVRDYFHTDKGCQLATIKRIRREVLEIHRLLKELVKK